MKVDMSPHAITMRLKKSSELRQLCIALGGDRFREQMKKKIMETGAKKINQVIDERRSPQ